MIFGNRDNVKNLILQSEQGEMWKHSELIYFVYHAIILHFV